MLIGIVLIVIGAIYIWKPNIFRRGLWMKTSVAIRVFSEGNYIKYMRILGGILIFAGLVLFIRS